MSRRTSTRQSSGLSQKNSLRVNAEVETLDVSVLEEFKDFYKDFPQLELHFKLLCKIGEGTRSNATR